MVDPEPARAALLPITGAGPCDPGLPLHARRRRAKGDRTQVVAHEDVLVFRKPETATAKAQSIPTRKAA
jgi:hypothetical protein